MLSEVYVLRGSTGLLGEGTLEGGVRVDHRVEWEHGVIVIGVYSKEGVLEGR